MATAGCVTGFKSIPRTGISTKIISELTNRNTDVNTVEHSFFFYLNMLTSWDRETVSCNDSIHASADDEVRSGGDGLMFRWQQRETQIIGPSLPDTAQAESKLTS